MAKTSSSSSSTTTTATTPSTYQKGSRPPLWKVWLVASRPHTLTASVAPVLVGYHCGISVIRDYYKLMKMTMMETTTSNNIRNSNYDGIGNGNDDDDDFNENAYLWLAIKWVIFCMLMQLGTNLHNDYADFVKGADTDKRIGQARATQRGWLTPKQTASAAGGILAIGLLLGIHFIFLVHQFDDDGGEETNGFATSTYGSYYDGPEKTYLMIFIVITSVFNAFAYTGGPWPLGWIGLGNVSIGYSGLGDLFVFLYFGLVATLMLPYMYIASSTTITTFSSSSSSSSSTSSFWRKKNIFNSKNTYDDDDEETKVGMALFMYMIPILLELLPYAIQVATLATNIIIVNNLRDRFTDIDADKRTLAVRFGATFCRVEYIVMMIVSYGLVLFDCITHNYSIPRLLPLMSLPLAWKEVIAIHTKDGRALNPHVGGSARVQFLFCILLSIAVRFSPGKQQ